MEYFCTFDVSKIIPKNTHYFCTWLLIPFSCIYVDITLKPAYIRMCAKGQMILKFSLMWSRVTCLLAFHMFWDRSDLIFHYPIEELYKEPFGYIEEGGIEEQENYSPLLSELILESASLCPLEHFVFFPRFPFSCELAIERWSIKVVEAQVGIRFLRFTDAPSEVVSIVISNFILIEISFPVQ